MLGDMSTEKHQRNPTTAATLRHSTMDSELVNPFAKKNKKASKTSQQAYDVPLDHSKDAVSLPYNQQTSNNFSQSGIMGMCNQIHQEDGRLSGDVLRSTTYDKYTQLNEINVQLDQRNANAHIDQIFIGRARSSKDGGNLESKQFSDALEILKLKRNLFRQSLQFAQRDTETVKLFLETKFSERGIRGTNNSQTSECSVRTNKQLEENLSCNKVKDQYTYSSNKSSSSQPSNKIVVLRPAPKVMETPEHVKCSCSSLHSHQRFKREGGNVKPTYFSFKEIKKRWKRAMGDNQVKRHWISSIVSFHKIPTGKGIPAAGGDKESPGFGTRKPANSSTHTTKRDKSHEKRGSQLRNGLEISTTDETVSRKLKPSTGSYSKDRKSDIFQEAKKHLSERLRNVDRSEILENRQTLRTLGRILCSPEHELYSAVSPKWNMKHGSVSSERIFSPRFSMKDDQTSDDKVTPLMPILYSSVHTRHAIGKPEDLFTFEVPSEPINTDFTCARHSPDTSCEGDDSKILETNDIGKPEDLFTFEVPSEPIHTDFTCARRSPDTSCEGDGFNCSMLASPSHSHDQIIISSFDISSSSPISPQEVVDHVKDGEEHQSPVSVLEPLFMEDAGSPKSIIIQSSKGPLQPLRIDFEEYALVSPRDPKIKGIDCMNDDESISAYMRAVLQAAGLNWEDPLLTKPSPDQVLHTSFSHREKLFQTKSHHDHELLFDCVNDVLLEVYEEHFGCSPWTSYLKPNTRAFPLEDHLVYEVVKDVKCLLLQQFVQPTLDQLVGRDIAKSASWLDIRLDTEELVYQIAEDILEESVVDAILMLHT